MAYRLRNKAFCGGLNTMIKDEYKAPKDYRKLKVTTKKPYIKTSINRIISQEKQHYKTLKKIKVKECMR